MREERVLACGVPAGAAAAVATARPNRVATGVAAAAALLLSLAGCGGSAGSGGAASGGAASGGASGPGEQTVTVFAAASLKESFTRLGRDFEAAHPDTRVVFNFGASSTLAAQLNQGAPADVFASASAKTMQDVVTAGAANPPAVFARNVLMIAVPADNPGRVAALADLTRPGVKLAVCQPAVPCGVLAAKVFDKAKLNASPVSREADVKAVLTKVTLGEVDAGLVYATDVKAAGAKVKGIALPAGIAASTEYPIATLTKAPNPTLAQAFADAVRSPAGTAVLTAAGFAAP